MTREEALKIAKLNNAAHRDADIAHMFKGGPAFDALKDYGYRHGWYRVGEFSFCDEEVTGRGPCQVQAAFAYL